MKRISTEFTRRRGKERYTTHLFQTYDFIYEKDEHIFRYMKSIFENGAEIEKEKSASSTKELMLCQEEVFESDLIQLAMNSNYHGNGYSQHSIVQEYFLKNDPYTIATELPIWSNVDNMSGFIDIVRIKIVKIESCDIVRIQLCDFKPKAHKEKILKVLTQLYYYKKMLIERIPDCPPVDCYYFDERHCYKLLS